jgi:hypothetical protein
MKRDRTEGQSSGKEVSPRLASSGHDHVSRPFGALDFERYGRSFHSLEHPFQIDRDRPVFAIPALFTD